MSDTKLQAIIQCAPCDRAAQAQYHRRWVLIDQEGQALAQEHPALAELSTEVRFGYLVLRAPGMLRLDIPMDVLEDDEEAFESIRLEGGKTARAVTEGDLANAWLSTYFTYPVRLMKLHPDEESPI
ncbi:MAG: MOSC N-terminal beta barrel domain-containing protein [Pelistega sp.]|nr:MOSC N-terminal beta barrel domain-containing protein [Pelistega sp.]